VVVPVKPEGFENIVDEDREVLLLVWGFEAHAKKPSIAGWILSE